MPRKMELSELSDFERAVGLAGGEDETRYLTTALGENGIALFSFALADVAPLCRNNDACVADG